MEKVSINPSVNLSEHLTLKDNRRKTMFLQN